MDLARSDSAGASHDLAGACRETAIRFSFGYAISEPVPKRWSGSPNQHRGRLSTPTTTRGREHGWWS
jgi:hypothetical protein